MGLLDSVLEYLNSGATVGTRLRSLDAKNKGTNAGLLGQYTNPDAVLGSDAANFASGLLGPMGAVGLGGVMTYHGTPHKFDKYDLSKIGTGEGAQAYGHGIYFAENPAVAKEYQQSLGGTEYLSGGKVVAKTGQVNTPEGFAATLLNQSGNDPKAAIALMEKFQKQGLNGYTAKSWTDKIRVAINDLANAGVQTRQGGVMHMQDLPDEVLPRMLQWDKPISQQPHVADVVGEGGDMTGGLFYNELSRALGGRDKAAKQLAKMGIPGVSYLDAGSRAGGKGTMNHVVWDQSLLDRMIPQEVGAAKPATSLMDSVNINAMKPDYGIAHRPMADAGGASRLHDLTPAFGEDIYGKNALQYFGSGDPREAGVLKILHSVRGNPDAEVTIYRGVPKDAKGGINAGDWVSLDKSVAQDAGEKLLSMKVKAKDITGWADSLLEQGYWPQAGK